MKSEIKELFLRSIKQDTPRVKLFKYRVFVPSYREVADDLREQMLKIALENKLIGQYRLIHDTLKQKLVTHPTYVQLNSKVTQQTNSLHLKQQKYRLEKNNQHLAATLLKLGQIYFTHAIYRQCVSCFEALILLKQESHRVLYQQYASQLALSYYFLNQTFNLCRFNSKLIDQAILKKSPDLCILRDINNMQYRRNMDKPFSNVVKMGLSNLQLSKNRVMSYNDLGFLFSLLSIAYKKKNQIGFIKWSSKLQNNFVNNNYKIVLETLKRQKQTRCFLPIINKIYEPCQNLIKNRILTQIVSSFDRCPFKIIQQMTGLNQGQIRIFVKNNFTQEFLFDPITSSVVYKRNAPLVREVNKLYNKLQAKYEQELNTLNSRIEGEDDLDPLSSLMRRGSGGRMGARMGGMGGMRGF